MTIRGDAAHQSLRILYAEDDRQILACTAELLHHHGHEVNCATDGSQALLKLIRDQNAFDVLITDQQMPHLDGLGLVEQSRRAGYRGRIVVFASALSESDRRSFTRLAVDAIVEKGSRAQTLLETLHRLSRSQAA